MATAGGGQKAERDGWSAHDAGPENRQPFRSLRRAAIDGWARNSRDGRVFHVARQGEAYHALSAVSCFLGEIQVAEYGLGRMSGTNHLY